MLEWRWSTPVTVLRAVTLFLMFCTIDSTGDTVDNIILESHPFQWTSISKARRSSNNSVEQDDWASKAPINVLRMRSDSVRCSTPRPRVIKVQSVNPHAYKRFVPSCVELHRCDRRAGCCDDPNSVCSPVKKQSVYMYFYVVSLKEHNGVASVDVAGEVERLKFSNHTLCGCRKRRQWKKVPSIGHITSSGWSIWSDSITFVRICVFSLLSYFAFRNHY